MEYAPCFLSGFKQLLEKAKVHVEDIARNRSITREIRPISFALSRIICPKNTSESSIMKFLSYLDLLLWEKKGSPIPPPHSYKQKTVKQFARFFSITTLIETGTFRGDMIEATKTAFDKIYSIELDSELYKAAKQRFSNDRKITVIKGDSSEVLPALLKSIRSPSLFWLDSHYSSGITAKGELETPVTKELKGILSHSVKNHVILIDDACLFKGQKDYPTKEEIERVVLNANPNLVLRVKNDIIRIYPRL